MADHSSTSDEALHPGNGLFGQAAKVIPYFRKKRNVLLFKLDIMLLLWMFVAGVRGLHIYFRYFTADDHRS